MRKKRKVVRLDPETKKFIAAYRKFWKDVRNWYCRNVTKDQAPMTVIWDTDWKEGR